jgi:hypothetical protein
VADFVPAQYRRQLANGSLLILFLSSGHELAFFAD